MQPKTKFLLLFVFFLHISLLFDSFQPLLNNKKTYFIRKYQANIQFSKQKDKRDVFKQNTTLTLYSITK